MEVSNAYAPDASTQTASYKLQLSQSERAPAPMENEPKIVASANGSKSTGNRNGTGSQDEMIALDHKLTSDFLRKTIDEANKKLEDSDLCFNYSVHEKTGEFVVKIINRVTKEVVREIPPEKHLDAVAKMWELSGILVDKKN